MSVIFWIMFLTTLESHQFEFDGTLKECKRIARHRTEQSENIQAGCYEINKKFKIIIK